MLDLWLKAFHFVGLIFWVGGLLVTTRICAIHAAEVDAAMRDRYHALEKRFYWGMGTAGFLLALVTGVWLLANQGFGQLDAATQGGAFHIKLTLVALLIVVHFMVLGGLKRLADTQEQVSPGKFKAYHVFISILMLASLIVVLPIRQAMYEKKVQQNAEEAAENAAEAPPTEGEASAPNTPNP